MVIFMDRHTPYRVFDYLFVHSSGGFTMGRERWNMFVDFTKYILLAYKAFMD